jgi:hypothetical protein
MWSQRGGANFALRSPCLTYTSLLFVLVNIRTIIQVRKYSIVIVEGRKTGITTCARN